MEYMKDHQGRMGKRILIVEGEKAAVAARAICGDLYIVLTWSNGAQAWAKADFGPLQDLRVLLWGDADKPGAEVMRDKIAPLLALQKCEVKILDPEGQTDGWDAADALAEGMDWSKFKDWATPRVTLYQRPGVISATAISENEKAIAAAKAELTVNIGEEGAVVTQSQREIWDKLTLSMTKGDYPAVNYDNVSRSLEGWPPLKDLVWWDSFHEKIFTCYGSDGRREWSDIDDTELAQYFQRELGFQRMTKECVGQGIRLFAHKHKRNEPKDWFETLKWDETERLPKFFHTYFGADHNIYTQQAGMNFWVGMVARVYRPGCKLDNMIVLEGPQGLGKSRSMETIGGPWYCEASESAQSKDFYMVLQGKLLVEIAELDSFGKADVTRIKQTISCPKDRYRAPYDTHPKDHYRQSIFVGTTNEQSYLKDTTGGRRFWPMFCRKIKNDDLARDREQLFAEAVLHYKQKDEWWLMPQQETLDQQDRRQHIDEWEHVIAAFLDRRVEITAIEIAVECLKIEIGRFDKPTQMRVGAILKHLKWERGKAWREGKTASIWTRRTFELVE
jgi:predicted P-loop ATPase